MFLIGVILSAIWAGSSVMFAYSDIDLDLGKFYEQLARLSPDALLKKARPYLLAHPRRYAVKTLKFPLAALFAVGSSAVFIYSGWEVLLGHVAAMGVATGVMLTAGPKIMGWRIQAFAQVAAQMVARKVPPGVAIPFLIEASKQANPYQRIAAAAGLASFPGGKAYERLAELTADKDPRVRNMALQRFGELGRWRAIVEQGKVSIPPEILERAAELKSPVALPPFPPLRSRPNQIEEERAMMPVLIQQADLRWHFPHLLCRKCLARPKALGTGEWVWVVCRKCGEADHLATNVKQVIGVLDGSFSWSLQMKGELHLGLWDESTKATRIADIDVLEVGHAPGVDMNWALAAILTVLEGSGRDVKTKVLDASRLSENSRRILDGMYKQ
ncbi:MAG: HEAT repeat domain-containing protein [Bacteroidia bacterium]